jgi:glycerophosphoryl diester phosphodiesterase
MRATLDSEFFSPPRPRVMAHRGDSGAYPENTMESFRAAVEAGAPYIELDVRMTRDGEVVVIHDEDLARISGRPGIVPRLNWQDLATFDAGFSFAADRGYPFRDRGVRVPQLVEVLGAFRREMFVIEVKQTEPSLIRAMFEVIERTGMRRRVLVASEYQRPLDEIRALAPGIPTCFSGREVAALLQAIAARDASYCAPADALQVPPEYESWRLVTPEIVDAAHRAGAEVHVWTVNDPAEMREMLALGVDGMITDFPARLLELLSERPA